MLFSTTLFLAYFLPFFLLIYHLMDRKYKNLFVLLASAFFYAWGGPVFIFVIFLTTLTDFFLVKLIHAAKEKRKRILLLVFSVVMNIGLLAVFKYGNFFVDNLNWFTGLFGSEPVTIAKLIPPLAISFFTFESLTYVIDVYRGVHAPLKNFWEYQMYILLFPKLLAGPIVRYHEIADQIQGRFDAQSADMLLTGFYRFVTGLAKKVLIANVLGIFTKKVFELDPGSANAGTAWLAVVAFAFQIYFDFSGYSDMALGLGKMMGFQLPENFNNPWISKSITEYWQRWHITLGSWMRNYLYIPLGGNRVESRTRLYFNLSVVFLVSGFWHGSTWNFVIWGAWHGIFMIAERAFLLRYLEKIPGILRILYTFVIAGTGYVLFCIVTLPDAVAFFGSLFRFTSGNWLYPGVECYLTLAAGALFAFWAAVHPGRKLQEVWYSETFAVKGHAIMLVLIVPLFILSLAYVMWSPFNPFIYFRF